MSHSRAGFTIVELLVVIGIMLFIVTITIVYSSQSRSQIALSVESAKIAGVILRAKQLAVATYGTGPTPTCGYGVYFDLNPASPQYSLFIYSPQIAQSSGYCPSLTTIESSTWSWKTDDMVEYSPTAWNIPLTNGLTFQNNSGAKPSVIAVLFYPPDPRTLMVQSNDGVHFETTVTSYINIATPDNVASSSISINPAGQVSF